jgi:TrpR-related protein YerC/YecD
MTAKSSSAPQKSVPRRDAVNAPSPEEPWMTDATRELARAVSSLANEEEALRFLRDLCTVNEIQEFEQRWAVARLLAEGASYHEISDRTGASSATISRVNQWLRYGRAGYRLVLERMSGEGPKR